MESMHIISYVNERSVLLVRKCVLSMKKQVVRTLNN